MKSFFFLVSLLFTLTAFTACSEDDDQLLPATEDIPYLSGGFSFDKAVLSPTSSNPDGTFKAELYLLESPASLDQNGLTGLPADVTVLTFQALPERGVLPDGEYTFGFERNGGNVLNGYIKDELTTTFSGLSYITSGTITVGTSGTQRTFAFDVRIVDNLNDQYDSSVTGSSLSGSVSVPLEVFE